MTGRSRRHLALPASYAFHHRRRCRHLGLRAPVGTGQSIHQRSRWPPVIAPLLAVASMIGWRGAQAYLRELAEQRRIRAIFSGYVSPAILDTILSGALRDGRAGTRQPLASLFADIRDFTAFCARLAGAPRLHRHRRRHHAGGPSPAALQVRAARASRRARCIRTGATSLALYQAQLGLPFTGLRCSPAGADRPHRPHRAQTGAAVW